MAANVPHVPASISSTTTGAGGANTCSDGIRASPVTASAVRDFMSLTGKSGTNWIGTCPICILEAPLFFEEEIQDDGGDARDGESGSKITEQRA